MHLHIENTRSLGEVFEVTKKRLREALLRHPQAADRLKITIGYDGDVYERALRTADALFGWTLTGATWRSVRHGSNGCMLTARE